MYSHGMGTVEHVDGEDEENGRGSVGYHYIRVSRKSPTWARVGSRQGAET